MTPMPRRSATLFSSALVAVCGAGLGAQDSQVRIRVTPAQLKLEVGQQVRLEAEAVDASGRPVGLDVFFFVDRRAGVEVSRDGTVNAKRPGDFQIVARGARTQAGGPRPSTTIPVSVAYPPLERIEFATDEATIHVGTTRKLVARVIDRAGNVRDDLPVALSSNAPVLATIDEFDYLTGNAPGRCRVVAEAEGMRADLDLEVVVNPVSRIVLTASQTRVRTGDVVHFAARTIDADGDEVVGVPVELSIVARPDDTLGQAATGQIEQDGRFVAEQPGIYTVVATCGSAVARRTLRADARNVQKTAELVGHGAVLDVHTSDFWVWEGADGRDYAVTGTWGANGEAYFWDVTDPANMERIAAVKVDARTVNDVKVSEDGRLCVISREGASNRRNGMVLIDVSDPRRPEVVSTFDENLTGGVHNLFISGDHVFALSAGRRYDVIDIQDLKNPHRVGSFELETPGHSIHDVWVEDGLAYSSNWRNGVQIVDVGNGIRNGLPESPVKVASYAYPSGWNHAAFPYRSRGTGKFYVIAGDETFPYGLNISDSPTYPRGWFHFIDFTDFDNPKEVARYQVPEAGTHNLWVEGDVLYAAYYNGGLRVVDISGELMGDLYRQGREIAWYLPTHKDGVIPNAPMTWGPQPHKGHIFFSDWNSGLWAVKLVEPGRARR